MIAGHRYDAEIDAYDRNDLVSVGPGSRQLDAQFSRDVRLGPRRVLSINLNATNLLNMVNYAAIDTVVNSPTFGQVLSVRPMRSMQAGLRFRF